VIKELTFRKVKYAVEDAALSPYEDKRPPMQGKDKARASASPTDQQVTRRQFYYGDLPIGQDIPEIHETAFVAESSTVVGKVKMEAHSSVWFNVAIRGDNELITIGENSNVQEGAVCIPITATRW
jgi:UDP-3-O-[3-hydroxymyristoyl] glucosamine N-acyltransferase